MVTDLSDLKMSDRFTHRIKVHPRKYTTAIPEHRFKFKLIIFTPEGRAMRVSHHLFREDGEQSIREFLELDLDGDWKMYGI